MQDFLSLPDKKLDSASQDEKNLLTFVMAHNPASLCGLCGTDDKGAWAESLAYQSLTDKLLLETLSVPGNQLPPRAAVPIELVSVDNLCKTGIFADRAGDFRPFRSRD